MGLCSTFQMFMPGVGQRQGQRPTWDKMRGAILRGHLDTLADPSTALRYHRDRRNWHQNTWVGAKWRVSEAVSSLISPALRRISSAAPPARIDPGKTRDPLGSIETGEQVYLARAPTKYQAIPRDPTRSHDIPQAPARSSLGIPRYLP